jgi:hypothetical protein
LREDLSHNLLFASEQRPAQGLLSAGPNGKRNDWRGVPNLSQQDFADMIGTTRQRVNALMGRFRKLGLIDYAHGLAGPQLYPERHSQAESKNEKSKK